MINSMLKLSMAAIRIKWITNATVSQLNLSLFQEHLVLIAAFQAKTIINSNWVSAARVVLPTLSITQIWSYLCTLVKAMVRSFSSTIRRKISTKWSPVSTSQHFIKRNEAVPFRWFKHWQASSISIWRLSKNTGLCPIIFSLLKWKPLTPSHSGSPTASRASHRIRS